MGNSVVVTPESPQPEIQNAIYSMFLTQKNIKSQTFWLIVSHIKSEKLIFNDIYFYFYHRQKPIKNNTDAQNEENAKQVKKNNYVFLDVQDPNIATTQIVFANNHENNHVGSTSKSNIPTINGEQHNLTDKGLKDSKEEGKSLHKDNVSLFLLI